MALNHIGQISHSRGRLYGDKTALIIGEKQFSFLEIDRMACCVANGLKSVGVQSGDRVTLYSQNCWEWVVSYHGIGKTGAVVNPINVMLTSEEVKFIVNDNGAKAVIASTDKGEPLLDLRDSTDLREVVRYGDDVPKGATAFEDWLHSGEETFEVTKGSAKTWLRSAIPPAQPVIPREQCSPTATSSAVLRAPP